MLDSHTPRVNLGYIHQVSQASPLFWWWNLVNPREGIKVHTGILSFRELHHGETCEGIFHTLIFKKHLHDWPNSSATFFNSSSTFLKTWRRKGKAKYLLKFLQSTKKCIDSVSSWQKLNQTTYKQTRPNRFSENSPTK